MSRLPFLVAAAIIAAAIADPVVESVSNTGIFGGGFADDNHLGVVPTLLVGALLVLNILALRFSEICRRSAAGSGDRLIDIARGFASRSSARDLPCVFVMQLIALFALESAEQFATGGRLLGGTEWLGGPVFFSLTVHALIGAGCTFALGAFMRAIVGAFAAIVRTALRFIWLAISRATGGDFDLDRNTLFPRAQAPHVRQIGGRAPPLLPIPA